MVQTRSLDTIPWSVLTEVFNLAFNDYAVVMRLDEAALTSHLAAVSYSKEDSIGLFDGDTLVGFLFIGRRDERAYDAGTAIIPAYRGKGLAHKLIDATIEHLSTRGVTSFTLEVLSENTRAKTLYEGHGFVPTRTLHCYTHSKEELASLLTTLALVPQNRPFVCENPFVPTWQNSATSINIGSYTKMAIFKGALQIGNLAFNSATGSIAQIVLYGAARSQEYFAQAIIGVAKHNEANEVRMVNVDAKDALLLGALSELGFEEFAAQEEMVRTL